jgi:hypothetical protein
METPTDNRELLADVWQKLPPEEKLNLFAEAKATGISSVVITFIFATAMAIGLKTPWVLWGTFFVLPMAFQIASGKAWRVIKPKALVDYSVARATACFFAAKVGGRNMNPSIILKGSCQQQLPDSGDDDLLSDPAELEQVRAAKAAWITLFPDSLVIFSESPQGAVNELSRPLVDRDLSITSQELDEFDDPRAPKTLIITAKNNKGEILRWTLSSPFTDTLSAFERRFRSALTARERMADRSPEDPAANERSLAPAGSPTPRAA